MSEKAIHGSDPLIDRLVEEQLGEPVRPLLPHAIENHFRTLNAQGYFSSWLGDRPFAPWSIRCETFEPHLLAAVVPEDPEARRITNDDSLRTLVAAALEQAWLKSAVPELALIIYGDSYPFGRPPNLPAAVFSCIEVPWRRARLYGAIGQSSDVKLLSKQPHGRVEIAVSDVTFPVPVGKIRLPENTPASVEELVARIRRTTHAA